VQQLVDVRAVHHAHALAFALKLVEGGVEDRLAVLGPYDEQGQNDGAPTM